MDECPGCGSKEITDRIEDVPFQYGRGLDAVTLLAREVTVYRCATCRESFTDDSGEDARDAAVREFLGRR